jgi:hypothetical protein
MKGNIATMALAVRNAKKKKRAVARGRGTQKTTGSPAKGRGATPARKKSTAKQATRKPARPRKSPAARPDAVLSAQLEAISHELTSLTALRDEIQDLRGDIEALSARIDELAASMHAGAREDLNQSEPAREPDDPAHTGPSEDGTSDVEA